MPNGGSRAPGSGLLGVKGPMTMRVRDQAYALDVVVGPDLYDPYSLPKGDDWYPQLLGGLDPPERVILAPTMGYQVDQEVLAVCLTAAKHLEALGTEIVTVETVFAEDPLMTFLTIWSIMRLRDQGPLFGTDRWDHIDPGLRGQMDYAREHLGPSSLADAIDSTFRYNAELAELFHREDATFLLCPTVAGQTPISGQQGTINGEESVTWVRFTYPFNLTRNPAGSVNAGFTDDGMPVGLQIVGRQQDDIGVLKLMCLMEDALACERRAPI